MIPSIILFVLILVFAYRKIPKSQPKPPPTNNRDSALRHISETYGVPRYDSRSSLVSQRPTAALLVKISTNKIPPVRGTLPISDARYLRMYVPRDADLNAYPLSCPDCGWCAMYTRQWVAAHDEFTCSRCHTPTALYKTKEFEPGVLMTVAEFRQAKAAHPERFTRPWVPSGRPTKIGPKINLRARITYFNGEQAGLPREITISQALGYELESGYKVTAIHAKCHLVNAMRDFKLHAVTSCTDISTGMEITAIPEWVANAAGLPISTA